MQIPKNTVVKNRVTTCATCGVEIIGYHTIKFCSTCYAERRKASAEIYKENKKASRIAVGDYNIKLSFKGFTTKQTVIINCKKCGDEIRVITDQAVEVYKGTCDNCIKAYKLCLV